MQYYDTGSCCLYVLLVVAVSTVLLVVTISLMILVVILLSLCDYR